MLARRLNASRLIFASPSRFALSDKADVEARCAEERVLVEWWEGDALMDPSPFPGEPSPGRDGYVEVLSRVILEETHS